jgi:tetratricopeptide (TPR) repeat protein
MHISMRIGLVLGIAFILLSCGFLPVIGQDLSQNPPSGYDKGVWVLTGRTIEEGESEPNCGNPAFYTCPRPTISANSVVAPYSWNDGDGKCHGEVLYTTTWTALPSVLTPATKLETKLDVSATSQQTCGNRYVGASIEMGVTIGNSPWFRPQDGFARIDWPTSGPTPAPASAIAKWDVPWGKIGDVIVLKINPFFGYRVRIAYTYTYQGQKPPAYLAISPINPPNDLAEAQVYTSPGDVRKFRVTVYGEGSYQVPDGTKIGFSLNDWSKGTDTNGAFIEPLSTGTINSEIIIIFHPPSDSYWIPTGTHDPSATDSNRMVIKAECGGKETTYTLYMIRPSASPSSPFPQTGTGSVSGPSTATDWINKGHDLYMQGKYDEAIKAYDEAIKLDPKYDAAWNNKGIALSLQGKYDEAIKAYDEAIRLDPKYTNAWNNKGWALNRLGKYDDAIKAYDEAIRLDPKYANAWNNKGVVLEILGKTTEASTAFAKAKELGIRANPSSK